MSSCQKSEKDEILQEIKEQRVEEIKKVSYSFLSDVINNMCVLEGTSGKIDMALDIDRRSYIYQALKQLVKDMGVDYEQN